MKSGKDFSDAVKSGLLNLSAEKLADANRARARCTLARNFRGIRADGIAESTINGYSAVMSVFLAYTAAEQIGKVTGDNVVSWVISDPDLAKGLRSVLHDVGQDMKEHISHGGLSEKLSSFLAENSDDVRIAATAIRVAVGHGTLSATGARTRSKRNQALLFRLSRTLIDDADCRFTAWVTSERSVGSAHGNSANLGQ